MDRESCGNVVKVFIQGIDYNLSDKDDDPYEKMRRLANQRITVHPVPQLENSVDNAIAQFQRVQAMKRRIRSGLAARSSGK